MYWWTGGFDTVHGLWTISKWRVPGERLIVLSWTRTTQEKWCHWEKFGAKLIMRWMRGVFVDKLDRTDKFLLLTPTGAMKTRCVRRLEGDKAWNLQFLNLCVGSPCNAAARTTQQTPTILQQGWVGQWQTCKKSVFATNHFGQVRTHCRMPRLSWHRGMPSKSWTRNGGQGWCNLNWDWWRNCGRGRRVQQQTHRRGENLSKDPVRMRVHWRVVSRQSTTFYVTCQLSTSAKIALHWVENSRKMNWRLVKNSSCETCGILTHLNWWMSCLQESTLTTWFGSMSAEVTQWGHDFVCVSSRPRDFGANCLRERQTGFSSSICWQNQRVARTLESLSSTFSVAFMHGRTDEEIYVKVPSGIKSSKFWRLKVAVNGTRKASKHWQEYSSDKLVTNMLFQQDEINPCIHKRLCDDLEQHGDDFLVCGVTRSLESWQRNSIHIFWWSSLKLWVWNLNTRVELIFSNVASLLMNLVGMWSWINGMWKVCWMQWQWIIANRWLLLDRRDRRATMRRRNWTQRTIESSDPVLESVGTWQSNASTFPSARRKSWERQLDRHRKSILWPTMRGGDVSKIILWNSRSLRTRFSISLFAIQNWLDRGQVHRDGYIDTKRPILLYRPRSMSDIRKLGLSLWTHLAEMHRWSSDQTSKKQSQVCTVVSTVNLEKSDLNPFLLINTKGGIRRLLHRVPQGGNGLNIGGAHKLKNVNYLWAREVSGNTERWDL